MFVVATFFNFLGPLILGIVLDHYGPRVCSLISIFFVSSGCFLFSISDKDKFPFFVPAISMIAFGGPGAQSAIIHLSNLFPTWKATATAFITGSFQLSFIVFLVFDQLWLFKKMSYSTLFLGYSVICVLNAVVSIFLWPDEPYSFDEQVKILEDEHKIDHEQAENPVSSECHSPIVLLCYILLLSLWPQLSAFGSYSSPFRFHAPQDISETEAIGFLASSICTGFVHGHCFAQGVIASKSGRLLQRFLPHNVFDHV